MTLRTIQPIGKKPVTMPRTEARIDMFAGMVNTKIVIKLATITAMIAAIWAWTRPLAIRTSSVTTGIAAAIVDSTGLCSGS